MRHLQRKGVVYRAFAERGPKMRTFAVWSADHPSSVLEQARMSAATSGVLFCRSRMLLRSCGLLAARAKIQGLPRTVVGQLFFEGESNPLSWAERASAYG